MSARSLLLIALIWLLPLQCSSCLLEDGRSAVYFSVFEDLKPGEEVGLLPIKGELSGSGNNIHLRLVKGEEFVELPKGSKQLLLTKPLDRDEGLPKFDALIECTMDDETNDFSKLNISVLVLVKDVNDNAPVFSKHSYEVIIPEELPIGTIVFADFEATDADQSGPNSLVHYAITEDDEFGQYLEIPDTERPLVAIKKSIDYEAPLHSFTVMLEARDNGDPMQITHVPLHVTIRDIDDLPPRFIAEHYEATATNNGQLVIHPHIHAVDGDALNAPVSYSLTGDNKNSFTIDSNGSVRISNNSPPSFAALLIHAYQTNNSERNSTAVLVVDLRPTLQFEHDRYSIQVRADSPGGITLIHVRASAKNESTLIKYGIDGTSVVQVDERTGKLSYKGLLVGKTAPPSGNFSYTLTATDGNQVARASLVVQLTTDTPCQGAIRFQQESYEMQLGSHPFVGEVALAQRSEPAILRLLNMREYFTLDSSGRISVLPGIAVPCEHCELIIAATDRDGRTALAKVMVHNLAAAMSTMGMLSLILIVVVFILLSLLILFVCRRITYARQESSGSRLCWVRRTGSTEAITCHDSELGKTHCYTVNGEKRVSDGSGSGTTKSCTSSTASSSPAKPVATTTSAANGEGLLSRAYRGNGKPSTGAHLVPITVTSHEGTPAVYF